MRLRIVVAITGATGVLYGITLLKQLKKMDVKTHLILSRWARCTIEEKWLNWQTFFMLRMIWRLPYQAGPSGTRGW